MTERICGWHECDQPIPRRPGDLPSDYKRRQACCQSHASMLGNWRAAQNTGRIAREREASPAASAPTWPTVTGQWPVEWEETKPFRRHNVTTKDGGFFYRPRVADRQSYVGNSSALLVRAGAE